MASDINKINRIAFYIGDLSKGGAEHVIRNLAEYFNSMGVDTYMVTKLKGEDEYKLSDGITRIIADISSEEEKGRVYNLYARIRKLRRIWKEIRPDIIVSFIRKNNLMALASARSLKIPVVVSVRSDPAREFGSDMVRRLSFALFRKAAGIVVLTNDAKEYFPPSLQDKCIVMPNAIDEKFVDVIEGKKNWYGIEGEGLADGSEDAVSLMYAKRRHEIITVGRIDDNKNQRMLVDAFTMVADKHPDWTLHIYGDGEGRMDLVEYVIGLDKKLAAEGKYKPGSRDDNGNYTNISDRIIFHGVTDNVASVMAGRAIFVLPSKQEGMPNALIEAMVMGMACISTDCPCGGPAELIKDGVNGLLVQVTDVSTMADDLDNLMSDDELRMMLGTQASKLIEKVHPDIVCRQWKEYLEGLI
ncbi:MAG: glycosyltransferase [Lachnospiraceae bacterium]|nr:glycosyltransferase [Lachnospiraceae bacterium]